MWNAKEMYIICRLLRSRISYDVFHEKEGNVNFVKIVLLYIPTACEDRAQENVLNERVNLMNSVSDRYRKGERIKYG